MYTLYSLFGMPFYHSSGALSLNLEIFYLYFKTPSNAIPVFQSYPSPMNGLWCLVLIAPAAHCQTSVYWVEF